MQLLHVAKHPVGIDYQLRAIGELASHDVTNGVNMVGIHGMGGIGKTTLAKALYNKIVCHFEGRCFLSNVREASGQFNGLVQLQEKLLNEVLRGSNAWNVDNVHKGKNIIKDRLWSKKVLIVLDDVHTNEQLDALVGGRNWFGRGSIIIATTRDRHLLEKYSFDKVHTVQLLDPDRSLELFSQHAFKQSYPTSTYLRLTKHAVRYCQGLPLALVILGSFLHKRDSIIWKSKLEELENILEPDVDAIFQISYKGLHDKIKKIFLDISCFFVGEDVNYTKNVLRACDLNPEHGITILIDLSFITIENGKIQMHDLVRQLGQTIVRYESSKPEKRSRLWVAEEVIKILKEKSGTVSIKAIKLDFHYNPWLIVESEAFRNMTNLRILIIQRATKVSTKIFEYIPNSLKWIEFSTIKNVQRWCSPVSTLVNSGIVGLVMKSVFDKHPGIILENCKMLKIVDLSHWPLLEESADFSMASNLEKLYLRECKNLKMIHESVASLSKLVTLDLEGCVNLEMLPNSYLNLMSLEVLKLSKCLKIEEIPDLSSASNLKELYLRDCYRLKIIHDSVGRFLYKLVTLDVKGCLNLERLPRYISKSSSLEFLNLALCLKLKKISDNSIEKFPADYLELKCLKVLNLRDCLNLMKITDFSTASNLLGLQYCFNLRMIDESVGSLKKLAIIILDLCLNLEKLPSSLKLTSLNSLFITDCRKLKQLPEFDENMKSLRMMKLDATAIKELPSSIGNLIRLENLNLCNCTSLIALPSEIHLLKALKELRLDGCSKLNMFPKRLSLNFSQQSLCSKLTLLDLKNCNISNSDFLETLSNVCTSLKTLNLSGNRFSYIPSLKKLTSLRILELNNCKYLRNIENLPNGLTRFHISGCTLLVTSPYIIHNMWNRVKK